MFFLNLFSFLEYTILNADTEQVHTHQNDTLVVFLSLRSANLK